MTPAETITLLLGVISILLGVIAFFLARLLGKMDGLFNDVHKVTRAFLLFRQRVSIMLQIPVDDDDDLTPQTTTT